MFICIGLWLSQWSRATALPANRWSKVKHRVRWVKDPKLSFQTGNETWICAFHMPTFYERQCVIDKGELKRLLNNKATNSRPWTNLLGCMSVSHLLLLHPSPYQSCCSRRGQQVFHFYQNRLLLESACLLHILCCLLVPTILAEVPFCLQEECNLTNFHKVEI